MSVRERYVAVGQAMRSLLAILLVLGAAISSVAAFRGSSRSRFVRNVVIPVSDSCGARMGRCGGYNTQHTRSVRAQNTRLFMSDANNPYYQGMDAYQIRF